MSSDIQFYEDGSIGVDFDPVTIRKGDIFWINGVRHVAGDPIETETEGPMISLTIEHGGTV